MIVIKSLKNGLSARAITGLAKSLAVLIPLRLSSRIFSTLVTRLVHCTTLEITDSCGNYPERDGTDTELSPTDAVQLLLWIIWRGPLVRYFRIHTTRSLMNTSQLSSYTTNLGPFRASWPSRIQDLDIQWEVGEDTLI